MVGGGKSYKLPHVIAGWRLTLTDMDRTAHTCTSWRLTSGSTPPTEGCQADWRARWRRAGMNPPGVTQKQSLSSQITCWVTQIIYVFMIDAIPCTDA